MPDDGSATAVRAMLRLPPEPTRVALERRDFQRRLGAQIQAKIPTLTIAQAHRA